MNVTYLCLGGNIGDRKTSLYQALLLISQQVGEITTQSNIYETEAWGVENQQAYLNLCIKVETMLSGQELIMQLLNIEQQLGRERTIGASYEPRTMDIDVLFYNQDIINTPKLVVPHPRLHLRKFVLIPLNDICSSYVHPVLNEPIHNLLNRCEDRMEVKLFNLKN
jgi:2-amino-4-hydroxy-6-hydroxymethyldihydropteridine diphosphokinase